MGELILREWRRDELRRIYVNDPETREPLGFFDRTTGEIVVRYKAREREVLAALKPFLLAHAPIAAQSRADARRRGRVRVDPGRPVGPEPPRQVEPALPAPEPASEPEPAPVESIAHAEVAPLPPAPEMDVDLSTDIDGATVQDRAALAAQPPAVPQVIQDLAAGLASTLAARMHRAPSILPTRVTAQAPAPARPPAPIPPTVPVAPPSQGTGGTRTVGKRLDKLRRDGWRLLESVRTGGTGLETVIEYLVIGRPGVFTIRTRQHVKARVGVEGGALQIDGTQYPYIAECRAEAESVARRLSSAGPPVRVTPVLALVGLSGLDLSRAPSDLLVCRGEMADHVLRDLPGILTNRDQMRVYELAGRPEIWRA